MKKIFFIVFLALSSTGAIHAASTGTHGYHMDPDLSDTKSLQRGARIFVNYCLSCHSAAYMRYNRLGKDLDIAENILKDNFMFGTDKPGDTMNVALKPADGEQLRSRATPRRPSRTAPACEHR